MNYKYTHWKQVKPISGKNPFDTLLDLFQQLLTIASGDVSQSLKWLTNIDKEYEITDFNNILLKKKITLKGGDLEVSKVEKAPGIISITVIPSDKDTGQLTLVFSNKPLKLKKWIVVDPQGMTTSVSLLSTQRDILLDKELFEVKLKETEDFSEF